MLAMLLCMLVSVFILGVPYRGSLLILFFITSLFLLSTLGMGLLISTITRNQFNAAQVALNAAFLPSIMLSGFIFQIDSMPAIIRAVTYIIPARYLNSFDPKELASHCMVDIDETFAGLVQPGDIMVGGHNFGCGSSREHAPIAIKASGIPVIIAASFARIFYRNAINVGLPVLEIGDAVKAIKAGDIVDVDLEKGTIVDKTTGDTFQARPLPGFVRDIAAAGGLINYIKGEEAHE
ncbi:MAG: ABC transporter permease [Megasphaera sp.]|nr:ABC transporter permease [Megasphaera sp.]